MWPEAQPGSLSPGPTHPLIPCTWKDQDLGRVDESPPRITLFLILANAAGMSPGVPGPCLHLRKRLLLHSKQTTGAGRPWEVPA